MRNVAKWSLALAAAATLLSGAIMSRAQVAEDDELPATQPTTQPSDRRQERGRGWGIRELREAAALRDRQGGYLQGRAPGYSYRGDELPTPEQWEDISQFMKEHSPVRWEMYEKLVAVRGEDDRWTQSARRRMAGRYNDLQDMRERHQEMYDFGLKQVVLEDRILGTLRDLGSTAENDQTRAKLRADVKEYVNNFLDERQARLKRLEEMVARETKTIERDRAAIDQLVEKQQERFEKEMSRMIEFWEDPERFRPATQSNP